MFLFLLKTNKFNLFLFLFINKKKKVDPPFIESLGNYVSEKNMKMPMVKEPEIAFESKKKYSHLINEMNDES